ncbi:hypothetical protein [Flavobacterium sp.]|uniref:hypothetical protein n=1 Tax=Flavobacterium sp. TaxID=239 RepID=UPI0026040FA9|nr:hypothetical protein [Flavobacterium sp.]MDD2985485.1 hypothetical protein [Flavobacterium sp.]
MHSFKEKTSWSWGNVDCADALIAGAPGGRLVQAIKPAGMALFNFDEKGFQSPFIGNKTIPSTLRDVTTGYIMMGLGTGVTPGNALNSLGGVPLNGLLNSGDILMNEIIKQDGNK